MILGILPNNRLYVMDRLNNRLVRIDPGVFGGGASGWAETDISDEPAAALNFEYWFNFS